MDLEEQLEDCRCCDLDCPGACNIEGTIGIDFVLLPVADTITVVQQGYCNCSWGLTAQSGAIDVYVDCVGGVITASTNQGSATQVVTSNLNGRDAADSRDDCCPPNDGSYQPMTLTPSTMTLDGVYIELIAFYFDCSIGGPTTTTTPPPTTTTPPPTTAP